MAPSTAAAAPAPASESTVIAAPTGIVVRPRIETAVRCIAVVIRTVTRCSVVRVLASACFGGDVLGRYLAAIPARHILD